MSLLTEYRALILTIYPLIPTIFCSYVNYFNSQTVCSWDKCSVVKTGPLPRLYLSTAGAFATLSRGGYNGLKLPVINGKTVEKINCLPG